MTFDAGALTEERHKTHGDYAENARISQELKDFFRDESNISAEVMSEVMWESLDMIALKLSRILSGKASEPDHWKDIAGYATLVVKSLAPRVVTDDPNKYAPYGAAQADRSNQTRTAESQMSSRNPVTQRSFNIGDKVRLTDAAVKNGTAGLSPFSSYQVRKTVLDMGKAMWLLVGDDPGWRWYPAEWFEHVE